jgi:hypothetical protein
MAGTILGQLAGTRKAESLRVFPRMLDRRRSSALIRIGGCVIPDV